MSEPPAGAPAVRETPKFTGIRTHRDPKGRFSVRFATDWAWFDIDDPIATAEGARREGVGAYPNVDDLATVITMWVAPLDTPVRATDLVDLREGVEDGLASLEDCRIVASEDVVLDNLVKFIRVYTFREGEVTRKRQQWLLYAHTWLLCLTWQGSTVEEYDYWFAMANQTFHTMELPHELMFATDSAYTESYEQAPPREN